MGAGSGIGDLIELTDAFEIGDGDLVLEEGMDVGGGLGGSSAMSVSGEVTDGIRGRRLAREGGDGGKSGKGD